MTHFLPRRLPRPRLHGRRAAGLSLLEMLLVIALIAAIGLITAAGLSRGFAGMQLRSAGKDIANQLRMVRAQAIARGEPQRFVIEPARRRWEGPTSATVRCRHSCRCSSKVPRSWPPRRGRA
jgi:general secretion pathway protein H